MKKTHKILLCYIIFVFVVVSCSVLFSAKSAASYLSVAIIIMGLAAIVCQKKLHGARFIDMGFRLNRNAFVGLAIALVFSAYTLAVHFWLPVRLGLMELTINAASPAVVKGVSPVVTAGIIVVFGGLILFVACLFGEELAFRGYILPRLEEAFGSLKAVVLCSLIFAIWHIPAYFSVYSGGAAEHGWPAVAYMVLGHGISAVPICILYLTTRELYGVSFYHAVINVFQYGIIKTPALGEASKDAIWEVTVLNEKLSDGFSWGWHVLGIVIMLALCTLAKKVTVTRKDIPLTSANA